jgi:hypothetical protein
VVQIFKTPNSTVVSTIADVVVKGSDITTLAGLRWLLDEVNDQFPTDLLVGLVRETRRWFYRTTAFLPIISLDGLHLYIMHNR